jgi:hypothetical protein
MKIISLTLAAAVLATSVGLPSAATAKIKGQVACRTCPCEDLEKPYGGCMPTSFNKRVGVNEGSRKSRPSTAPALTTSQRKRVRLPE